jgi:hypothetical protein
MPQLVASITKHQHILIVILATCLTWLIVIVLVGYLEEHGGVEVCHLGAIFDNIG